VVGSVMETGEVEEIFDLHKRTVRNLTWVVQRRVPLVILIVYGSHNPVFFESTYMYPDFPGPE